VTFWLVNGVVAQKREIISPERLLIH
jgi:hypothetical protein